MAPHIGTSLNRVEDELLVRGAGTYVGDITPAGCLYLHVVRSPFPHAEIGTIDMGDAADAPGVRLVVTPQDVAHVVLPPIPHPERHIPTRHPLAQGKALMPGDAVAAIVADSELSAVDASLFVDVDYEPLPIVGDAVAAIDADPIYPEFGTNVVFDRSKGDKDAFDAIDAAVTITGTVRHQRIAPNPMETRRVVAVWENDLLTVHLSTQASHVMAEEIASAFSLRRNQVRVVAPFVGGAFGCKFDLAEEEALAIHAAMRLGRPVKWVETRREHMQTIGHGRAQIHEYTIKADTDGRIVGLFVDSIVDNGCRARYFAPGTVTPSMGTGTYDIGVYASRQRVVFTNRATRGIYRGAGRPEATLTIERGIDKLARQLGVDPAEVRRRNFIAPDAFPFDNRAGYVYDSGDYEQALDLLLETADYQALRTLQAEARAEGRLVGIGLASYVEVCAFEAWSTGAVEVFPDGSVTISAGTVDQGQGHRVTFAQIAADVLGIDPSSVRTEQGDTMAVPYGFGTDGSRSVAQGGSAVHAAAQQVATKAREIAAHLLEASADDIELVDGHARVKGTGVDVSWAEIADAAFKVRKLPPGAAPGLDAEVRLVSEGKNFPFGSALCAVEIDPETGELIVIGYWEVDDAGVIINPKLAAGQRHGGVAQGLGQALTEEVVYDQDGNLVTATLMDYALPTGRSMPQYALRETVTPTDTNPLGAKGVGEIGTIGSTAAAINAVVDALSPLGVEDLDGPLTPEKIWRAMHAST